MGSTWGTSGADRTQVGPMLATWILLSTWSRTTCRARHIPNFLLAQLPALCVLMSSLYWIHKKLCLNPFAWQPTGSFTCPRLLGNGICWAVTCTHLNASINSLWPSDTIWRQGPRSTLAQVMACCLMSTNVDWSSLGQFHKRYLNHQSLTSIWKLYTGTCLKFHWNLPGANELNNQWWSVCI